MLFYVLVVCIVTLPPGVNPIAVDKYIYNSETSCISENEHCASWYSHCQHPSQSGTHYNHISTPIILYLAQYKLSYRNLARHLSGTKLQWCTVMYTPEMVPRQPCVQRLIGWVLPNYQWKSGCAVSPYIDTFQASHLVYRYFDIFVHLGFHNAPHVIDTLVHLTFNIPLVYRYIDTLVHLEFNIVYRYFDTFARLEFNIALV